MLGHEQVHMLTDLFGLLTAPAPPVDAPAADLPRRTRT